MTTYRSLVGGFYADPDKDTSLPASIRYNNPGAINSVAWVQASPGYVHSVVIKGNNPIAVFETPEQGVALWYDLLVKYRKSGAVTLNQIITRYGGGQDYSAYVQTVAAWAELAPDALIDLEEDDDTLLDFAKAMFRYEAGKPSPLSDKQILYGFELARGHEQPKSESFVDWLIELIKAFMNLWHKPTPKPKPSDIEPWLAAMRSDLGQEEIPGPSVNPRIIKRARQPGIIFPNVPGLVAYGNEYTSDDTQAWCGAEVGGCLAEAGIMPPFGPGPYDRYFWADSYIKWGKPSEMRRGAIACFGGHVAMVDEVIDADTFWCIGGNQSSPNGGQVTRVKRNRSSVKAFRWPQ